MNVIEKVCAKHKIMFEGEKQFRKLEKHEMTSDKVMVLCDGPICLEDAVYKVEEANQ